MIIRQNNVAPICLFNFNRIKSFSTPLGHPPVRSLWGYSLLEPYMNDLYKISLALEPCQT